MSASPMSEAHNAIIDQMTDKLSKLLKPFAVENKLLALKVEFLAEVGDQACMGGYVGESEPGALEHMQALASMGTKITNTERSN